MLYRYSLLPEIINRAGDSLPKEYIEKLRSKPSFELSLVARYFLYEKFDILVQTDTNGIPIIQNNNFWNISHSNKEIFIAYCPYPIGVDIEYIKQRGAEVFGLHKENEYLLLGKKNLIHFYHLWTLKESIIKLGLDSIDNIDKIVILTKEKITFSLDGIEFHTLYKSKFRGKKIISLGGDDENFSYCISIYGEEIFDFQKK